MKFGELLGGSVLDYVISVLVVKAYVLKFKNALKHCTLGGIPALVLILVILCINIYRYITMYKYVKLVKTPQGTVFEGVFKSNTGGSLWLWNTCYRS